MHQIKFIQRIICIANKEVFCIGQIQKLEASKHTCIDWLELLNLEDNVTHKYECARVVKEFRS